MHSEDTGPTSHMSRQMTRGMANGLSLPQPLNKSVSEQPKALVKHKPQYVLSYHASRRAQVSAITERALPGVYICGEEHENEDEGCIHLSHECLQEQISITSPAVSTDRQLSRTDGPSKLDTCSIVAVAGTCWMPE